MEEKAGWKPTRAQLGVATLLVLEGVFVCLVGLRQPLVYVVPAAIILWLLVVVGFASFNFIRAFRRS